MTRKNIFAFTQPTITYPGYISVNEESDGLTTVSVRSPGNGGTNMGMIAMTSVELRKLADQIYEHLGVTK